MTGPKRRRTLGYHTATVRNAFLTRLPDALVGGLLKARHVRQPIALQELSRSASASAEATSDATPRRRHRPRLCRLARRTPGPRPGESWVRIGES